MWSPFRWCGRSLVVFVEQPILLWVVQRVDHFGHKLVLLGNLEHGAGILVTTAVISRREYREELAASEALEAVHDALVGSQDKAAPVGIEEVLDAIGSKLDDVSCAVRITDEVRLNAQVLITVCRVRPENVDDELLLGRGHFVDDLERSLDLLDLVQAQKCAANATVQADNFLVNHRSQWKPVKQIIDFVKDGVDVGWFFTQATAALFSEAESIVDPLVLVVTSQQVDLFRILDFESHQ